MSLSESPSRCAFAKALRRASRVALLSRSNCFWAASTALRAALRFASSGIGAILGLHSLAVAVSGRLSSALRPPCPFRSGTRTGLPLDANCSYTDWHTARSRDRRLGLQTDHPPAQSRAHRRDRCTNRRRDPNKDRHLDRNTALPLVRCTYHPPGPSTGLRQGLSKHRLPVRCTCPLRVRCRAHRRVLNIDL